MLALACSKVWDQDLDKKLSVKLGQKILLIRNKEDLNKDFLIKNNITKIFFPHWSYIINNEIFENFECIIFHMTDLPFGRGGSPLQNLLSRGIYETKMTALKCEAGIDTGPIYLKRDLTLEGSAQDIFKRATMLIFEMIIEIESNNLRPEVQIGDVVEFKRRTPEDGNLNLLRNIVQVYDYIRMLDAEGYPPAFLKINNFKLEFINARLENDQVVAEVRIKNE
ncbi:MAG: hypothetical protein L6Q33_07860 [Bacteriovoracaceae bacterium]|nr:hypothetical protein [Bacteriovoracaceae bacterium]